MIVGESPTTQADCASRSRTIALDYFRSFTALLKTVDLSAVDRVLRHLQSARDSGATIYVAGNGGSAATASHWTNDLGKATKRSGRSPFRIMCLSDSTSWMTALANDEGYERVFAGQLENFARPRDILIVISASGNSANLVRAVELAKTMEMITIGMLGFDGGVLKNLVSEFLWLPSEKGSYELVEDGHMLLCHVLTKCLVSDHP